MRAVIQRVSEASVTVNQEVIGQIKIGFLILLGIEENDTEEDAEWLAGKIVNMRIFSDEAGLMNKALKEVAGNILLISQFTLHAGTKKGNRPSFIRSARPEKAIPLYEFMIAELEGRLGNKIETGVFGTDMRVRLVNDGPVTIIMDSKDKDNH